MDVIPSSQDSPLSEQSAKPPTGTQPRNSLMAPADDIAQATEPSNMPSTKSKKSSRMSTKTLVIILVSIGLVLLILLGVALFVNYKNSEDPEPVAPTVQSEQVGNKDRVSSSEIDETVTEIDNTLNTLNDSEDFKPDDLKDSNLGL